MMSLDSVHYLARSFLLVGAVSDGVDIMLEKLDHGPEPDRDSDDFDGMTYTLTTLPSDLVNSLADDWSLNRSILNGRACLFSAASGRFYD